MACTLQDEVSTFMILYIRIVIEIKKSENVRKWKQIFNVK